MNKNLRRIAVFIAAVVVLLSLNGCASINFTDDASANRVKGKGPVISTTFPVDAYTKVNIETTAEVIYSNATSDEIKVELQENLLDHLEVLVTDGTLTIKSDVRFAVGNGKTPKIYLYSSTLESLVVRGTVEINQADPIVGDQFTLDVSGACDAGLTVDVKQLNMRLSGAGDVTMRGTASQASVKVSGAGNIDALDLQTEDTTVDINGVGSIEISCSENLDVSISGAGDLGYKGDPVITKNVSGAGSVYHI